MEIKSIWHIAYPQHNSEILDQIFIKQLIFGLKDERSRKRVILKNPKTLTEAAQYARFLEAEARTALTHLSLTMTFVNSLNFQGRINSSGRYCSSRGPSLFRFCKYQSSGRGQSRGPGGFNVITMALSADDKGRSARKFKPQQGQSD